MTEQHESYPNALEAFLLVVVLMVIELFVSAAVLDADLLIGVNDYATESFTDLRGAVNDVETVRQLLVQRFGFPEANVATLTASSATRAGILDALRKSERSVLEYSAMKLRELPDKVFTKDYLKRLE